MNKKITIILIASLMVGALILSGCTQSLPADASNTTNLRTLSVSGTGTVTLVPDIAYINIGVHSEAENVTTSLNDNNELATAISTALQAEGIAEKDIQTANFNVYPMQKYDEMGQPSGTVYVVENTVYVTVRDLSNLGKLLDIAITAGANNIYGINFDVADRDTALEQARDLAIQDGKEKAQAVADVAGVTLGAIQSINVAGSSYVQTYKGNYGIGGGGEASSDTSVPVSAGQIVITYDANLIYEIN
ncbi:MAG: SIMPL domain-containing protein [Anaerolineaceae bacterium]